MDLDAVDERIAAVHRGRKWILVGDTAVGATSMVEKLREWGADGIMVVAAGPGVGELPEADRIHYTGARGGEGLVMDGIRANLAAVEKPSPELEAAVAAFDPERKALVLGGLSREPRLLGREVYGSRPQSWALLEDKMLIDELCDEAGIARAPSRVVPVAEAPGAAEELAGELGTVWVADNREGWHGGGTYVRWVRGSGDVAPAARWFAEHANRVRVMPFLDGVPCSIHGFNTGDGAAVFSPVEMLIFRHADRPEFIYARAANFWDPPTVIRDQMRAAARAMGGVLRRRVGYLGCFGIDGVATSEGFRPTELNPRCSIGHGMQAQAADIPIGSLQRLVVSGDLDVAAADLEATVEGAVATSRGGNALLFVGGDRDEPKTGLVFDGSGFDVVGVDEPNDVVIEIGPGPYGPVLLAHFDKERTPIGPRVAPRALRSVEAAAELWGLDLPPMVIAPDRAPS